MDQVILKATKRNLLKKKVKILRKKGLIPAILYGQNFQNIPLSIDKQEFIKLAKDSGEATLINLEIPDQKPHKILIRNIQREPVYDEIKHIDLYKVDMSKEIETEIPLEFFGIAPAVEELEGNFISNKDSIKVECLPDKLAPVIKVDISILKTFEDLIHVKDLNVPEGIEVLENPEDTIAQVTPPRSEEELKEIEETTAASEEKTQIETMETEAEKEKIDKEAKIEAEEKKPTQPEEEKSKEEKTQNEKS